MEMTKQRTLVQVRDHRRAQMAKAQECFMVVVPSTEKVHKRNHLYVLST